jgi:hypothetical protein
VVKQEELKYQLRMADEKCSSEVTHNRKLQNMLYEEDRELQHERNKERGRADKDGNRNRKRE